MWLVFVQRVMEDGGLNVKAKGSFEGGQFDSGHAPNVIDHRGLFFERVDRDPLLAVPL
jgi:hypothetical protein